MPQRRFKFKLCRLARGERSLDSLPIIQLLLPSPCLSFSRSFSLCLVHSGVSVCCLFSWEVLSPGWIVDFSLPVCPLCPCESSQEKVSHSRFLYMILFPFGAVSLLCIQLSLIRGFFSSFRFLFRMWREACANKKLSPLLVSTSVAYSSSSVMFCRFSCSLWAWCEREAEECVIPQSACCFTSASSFMWDLEIVWYMWPRSPSPSLSFLFPLSVHFLSLWFSSSDFFGELPPSLFLPLTLWSRGQHTELIIHFKVLHYCISNIRRNIRLSHFIDVNRKECTPIPYDWLVDKPPLTSPLLTQTHSFCRVPHFSLLRSTCSDLCFLPHMCVLPFRGQCVCLCQCAC